MIINSNAHIYAKIPIEAISTTDPLENFQMDDSAANKIRVKTQLDAALASKSVEQGETEAEDLEPSEVASNKPAKPSILNQPSTLFHTPKSKKADVVAGKSCRQDATDLRQPSDKQFLYQPNGIIDTGTMSIAPELVQQNQHDREQEKLVKPKGAKAKDPSIYQLSGMVDTGTMSASPELMQRYHRNVGGEYYTGNYGYCSAFAETKQDPIYRQSGMVDTGKMSVSPKLVCQYWKDSSEKPIHSANHDGKYSYSIARNYSPSGWETFKGIWFNNDYSITQRLHFTARWTFDGDPLVWNDTLHSSYANSTTASGELEGFGIGLVNATSDGLDFVTGGPSGLAPHMSISPDQQEGVFASNILIAGSLFGGSGLAMGLRARTDVQAVNKVEAPKPKANWGNYRPPEKLRMGPHGEKVPESNLPHSQIGSSRGGDYTQAREWGFDPDGKLVPQKDIDFTDHNRPSVHSNPHQHRYIPNITGGTLMRDDAEPFNIISDPINEVLTQNGLRPNF